MQLLFASHVKEALVQGINPLSEVEVAVRNRLGQDARRHLSFHFNRVQEDGVVRHLLVTVQDISTRIELEAKLQSERQRSQKEFAMLLKAIDADPALLRQFVARAEAGLLEINDIMRSTSAAHGEAAILKRLDEIARRLHSLKGDAGTLGLETVANQAHLFESELQRIRQSGGARRRPGSGTAIAAPAAGRPSQQGGCAQEPDRPAAPGSGKRLARCGQRPLAKLAQDVADGSGKKVHAVVGIGSQSDLHETTGALVREIAVQLLRNAVVHGVETPQVRAAAGKPEEGKVEVQLVRGETEWTLAVRDDGAGLSATTVRQQAARSGLVHGPTAR